MIGMKADMSSKRTERIRALLKGIETGDPNAVAVVNQAKYIQHNPQTHEGGEGLAALFKRLSKTSPRVNVVRIFEDGDFVFAHTEYDFSSRKIGFEIFALRANLWSNTGTISKREKDPTSGAEVWSMAQLL